MLALSSREQQKDVSVVALLKTWANICTVQYIVRCRHTQLRFPLYTSGFGNALFFG